MIPWDFNVLSRKNGINEEENCLLPTARGGSLCPIRSSSASGHRSTKERTCMRYLNGEKIKHTVMPVPGGVASHNSKITMDIYTKVKYNKRKELAAVVNGAFGQ